MQDLHFLGNVLACNCRGWGGLGGEGASGVWVMVAPFHCVFRHLLQYSVIWGGWNSWSDYLEVS